MTTKIPLSVQSGDVKEDMRESVAINPMLLNADFAHRLAVMLTHKFGVVITFLQKPSKDALEQTVIVLANGKPIKEVIIDDDNPKKQGHANFLDEAYTAVKEFAAK